MNGQGVETVTLFAFLFDVTVADMTSYRTEEDVPLTPNLPPRPPLPQPPLMKKVSKDPVKQMLQERQLAIGKEMEAAYFTHLAKQCEAEAVKHRITERTIGSSIEESSPKPLPKRARPETAEDESHSGPPKPKKAKEDHPVDKAAIPYAHPTVKFAEATIAGETIKFKIAKIPLDSETLYCLSDIVAFVTPKRNQYEIVKRELLKFYQKFDRLERVYKLPAVNEEGRKIGGTGTFYAGLGYASLVLRTALDCGGKPEMIEFFTKMKNPIQFLQTLAKFD